MNARRHIISDTFGGAALFASFAVAFFAALLVLGVPLAWLGGLLAAVAAALLLLGYLIARLPHPVLDRMEEVGSSIIYLRLMTAGEEAWRPVEAKQVDDNCFVVIQAPTRDEQWEFEQGQTLRCEARCLSGEMRLVATGTMERPTLVPSHHARPI